MSNKLKFSHPSLAPSPFLENMTSPPINITPPFLMIRLRTAPALGRTRNHRRVNKDGYILTKDDGHYIFHAYHSSSPSCQGAFWASFPSRNSQSLSLLFLFLGAKLALQSFFSSVISLCGVLRSFENSSVCQ